MLAQKQEDKRERLICLQSKVRQNEKWQRGKQSVSVISGKSSSVSCQLVKTANLTLSGLPAAAAGWLQLIGWMSSNKKNCFAWNRQKLFWYIFVVLVFRNWLLKSPLAKKSKHQAEKKRTNLGLGSLLFRKSSSQQMPGKKWRFGRKWWVPLFSYYFCPSFLEAVPV